MATEKNTAKPNFSYPTQDDVRLNPKPKEEWGADHHLPETEAWRQYDPSQQTREYEFLLKDVLKVDKLSGKVKGYEDNARNFQSLRDFEQMATEMHDVSHKGDRDPVKMKVVSDAPGKRHIQTMLPPYISGRDGSEGLHQKYSKGGWAGVTSSADYEGGQGVPHAFGGALAEMAIAANPGYAVLEGLTKGVIASLEAKASEEIKETWLPRLNKGQFTGAMVMTEPNFGSELTNVETTYQLSEDGKSGKLYGYKRYLSSADHDATVGPKDERNIVHMVLARTADADGNLLMKDKQGEVFPMTPENEGRKGRPVLTLTLVPRVLLDKDGNYIDEEGNKVDEPHTNNVRATKLNDKMGLEVQSNTDAAYDGSIGYTVGEVGDGLKNMFVIMNEARIGVGLQGTGIAEICRQNVERYTAFERKQGPAGELINYPNVQENVLNMRWAVDAGRSIAAEVGMAMDVVAHGDSAHYSEAEKKEMQRYVDVMTPLVKWGGTEKGDAAVDAGQQMMGGAGYMREWGIAQNRADVRISRIYEGANGLLAVALAGTQLKNMDAFLNKVRGDLKGINADPEMAAISRPLNKALATFEDATQWMQASGLRAKGGDPVAAQEFQAAATHYMELMYGVASGTALAKNAQVAKEKLKDPNLSQEDAGFFQSKMATAKYYTNAVLAPEHEMHYNKMRNTAKHLELPDLELEPKSRTFKEKGAQAVTLGIIKGKDLIDRFRGGQGQQRG